MAITNASRLADFGTGIGTEGAIIQVDNTNARLGIGTTNPQAMLQVGTGVSVYGNSGIVSATSFYGDGSNLTGLAFLAANSVDSDQYVDGSIDNAHLADDAVDSDELAAGSVDISHLAAGTDGKIITWDANGDAAVVGPGVDGQVLTSTGAGSPPAFEDVAAGGITSAQQFRIAADLLGSASGGTVLIGWEEVDTDYQAIGSNWSQSSGIFSCSATGIYLCSYTMVIGNTTTEDSFDPNVQISTDSGSNYTTRSRTWAKVVASDLNQQDSPSNSFMVDVSNTSTFRLRYRQSQDNDIASNTTISGSSTETLTNIMFIRLGDT